MLVARMVAASWSKWLAGIMWPRSYDSLDRHWSRIWLEESPSLGCGREREGTVPVEAPAVFASNVLEARDTTRVGVEPEGAIRESHWLRDANLFVYQSGQRDGHRRSLTGSRRYKTRRGVAERVAAGASLP
eukprot:2957123-Prymnesium_polylepis.1